MPHATLHAMLSLEATLSAVMDEEGQMLPALSRQEWWKKPQALNHWESYYLLQAVLRGEVPVIIEADIYKRIRYRLEHPREGDADKRDLFLTHYYDLEHKNPWIRVIISFFSVVFF